MKCLLWKYTRSHRPPQRRWRWCPNFALMERYVYGICALETTAA